MAASKALLLAVGASAQFWGMPPMNMMAPLNPFAFMPMPHQPVSVSHGAYPSQMPLLMQMSPVAGQSEADNALQQTNTYMAQTEQAHGDCVKKAADLKASLQASEADIAAKMGQSQDANYQNYLQQYQAVSLGHFKSSIESYEKQCGDLKNYATQLGEYKNSLMAYKDKLAGYYQQVRASGAVSVNAAASQEKKAEKVAVAAEKVAENKVGAKTAAASKFMSIPEPPKMTMPVMPNLAFPGFPIHFPDTGAEAKAVAPTMPTRDNGTISAIPVAAASSASTATPAAPSVATQTAAAGGQAAPAAGQQAAPGQAADQASPVMPVAAAAKPSEPAPVVPTITLPNGAKFGGGK